MATKRKKTRRKTAPPKGSRRKGAAPKNDAANSSAEKTLKAGHEEARQKESSAKQPEVDPPEKALAQLKACGGRLEGRPDPKQRIGKEGQWREPIDVREYLIWRLLRIRGKNGRLGKLMLNQAQQELERSSTKHNIVLKARQLGVTTYVAARFFINTITREGTLSVQVAHDQRSAEEIFRIVHRFLENLPESLRKGALVTSRANVRQIVFPGLDSEYRVETAADPNAGRGLTIHNLHCSEVARWPRDVAETLASLRAAVPPDGEIFLESTANGAGGVFYNEWQHAGETGYTRHFFPWWWDPSYRRPSPPRSNNGRVEMAKFSDDELELMQKNGLDAAQIGFRREMRANFRNRAPEEYAEDPESCFLASGESVFDCKIIDERLRQPAPIIDESHNGRLLTFLPPVGAMNGAEPKQYVMGVDPAGGGVDGDYSCAQVVDVESGHQCAELRGHYRPEELAAMVAALARKYNEALVAVERNNHGHAVIALLLTSQKYTHLYGIGDDWGWLTNSVTRPRMLAGLMELLSSAPFMFLSPRLLEECRTFIRQADGSCSAASWTHDDTVIAMAIAHAVRSEVMTKRLHLTPSMKLGMPQPA